MTTDRAPRTEWPPGAGPPVPRGGPPRATAGFEAVLDSKKAWTAPAGGPKKEPVKAPDQKQAPAREHDPVAAPRRDDHPSADAKARTDAVAPAADAVQAPDQAASTPAQTPVTPAPAGDAEVPVLSDVLTELRPPAGQVEAQIAQSDASPAAGSTGAKPAAGAAGVAQTPVAPTAPAEVPAAAEAAQGAPTGEVPEAPVSTPRTPESRAPAQATTADAEAPAREQAPSAQAPRAAAAPAPEARAAQSAPESAPPARPAVQAAQAPQAPQAPASAPAQQASAAAAGRALAATAPSTLAGTVESVQATLRLAASQGVTRARLALHPAELGGVEVNLRSSAAGLVATVRADSPEAAKLLQQAAGQLRSSLEEQGLTLLQLDIGSSGDRQVGAGAQRDGRSSGAPGEELATPDEDEAEVTASVRLPNGVLVDVLA